jgi:hypothetical protein
LSGITAGLAPWDGLKSDTSSENDATQNRRSSPDTKLTENQGATTKTEQVNCENRIETRVQPLCAVEKQFGFQPEQLSAGEPRLHMGENRVSVEERTGQRLAEEGV